VATVAAAAMAQQQKNKQNKRVGEPHSQIAMALHLDEPVCVLQLEAA
jgi:hypothetical protein